MNTATSVTQWFIPVRVSGTYVTSIEGRPALVRYSAWSFRSRRFGRKREWAYIDA